MAFAISSPSDGSCFDIRSPLQCRVLSKLSAVARRPNDSTQLLLRLSRPRVVTTVTAPSSVARLLVARRYVSVRSSFEFRSHMMPRVPVYLLLGLTLVAC